MSVKGEKMKQPGAIPLPMTGAVGAVLNNVFQSVIGHQASEIAIKAFIEGRQLKGEWELDLVARLVPARPKPTSNGHLPAELSAMEIVHNDG